MPSRPQRGHSAYDGISPSSDTAPLSVLETRVRDGRPLDSFASISLPRLRGHLSFPANEGLTPPRSLATFGGSCPSVARPGPSAPGSRTLPCKLSWALRGGERGRVYGAQG